MRVLTVAALFLAMSAAASGQAGEPNTSQDRASQVEQNRDSASQSGTSPAKPSDSSHAANIAPQVPAYVIYRFFFLHLDNLDQVALQEEAKGNNGDGWRTHEQRAARLLDEEGKILKQVAYDCNKAIRELDEKEQSIALAFQSQHPNGESLTLPPPPELLSLQDEKIAVVSSHISDLRVQLGADAFKKLDDYVQSKFTGVSPSAPAPQSKRSGGQQ
jgi:hypothetical protein